VRNADLEFVALPSKSEGEKKGKRAVAQQLNDILAQPAAYADRYTMERFKLREWWVPDETKATWAGYAGVWHLKENPGGGAPQMRDRRAVGGSRRCTVKHHRPGRGDFALHVEQVFHAHRQPGQGRQWSAAPMGGIDTARHRAGQRMAGAKQGLRIARRGTRGNALVHQ
jgi:hypothetical protein